MIITHYIYIYSAHANLNGGEVVELMLHVLTV